MLLVDDHSLIRMGFRLVLDAEPDIEVVGEAADGTAAVAMCSALRPDVVLMDVRMPGHDGIEATHDIVAAGLPCSADPAASTSRLSQKAVVFAYESRLITPGTPVPDRPG